MSPHTAERRFLNTMSLVGELLQSIFGGSGSLPPSSSPSYMDMPSNIRHGI